MRAFAILIFVAALVIPVEAQTPAVQALTLGDLERIALERNPLVGQARAAVDAAAGRTKQAGLYPNPVLSAVGEEISAGPIIRGGEYGGGIQQRIVTGGKLGLSRRIADQEQRITEEAAKAQRQRLLNAVRLLYYQALGDQYRVQVRTNLVKLANEAVRISDELFNVGQADRPDQLEAEVEAKRIQLELSDAQDRQERTWRQLTALLNDPVFKSAPLAGDLENVPRLDIEQALAAIYADSPEVKAAAIDVTRSEIALARAQKEKIPDVVVGGGVRHNNELLEIAEGSSIRQPVGAEGFFDISVEIPIFNRNQGNVAAARADLAKAKLEVDRTKLALRARLAETYRDYRTAITRVDQYKQDILPKAQRAYDLYLSNFRQMAGAYPQALIAQRNFFQLQDSYADALVTVWQRSVEIQGLLLTGGMDMSGGMQ